MPILPNNTLSYVVNLVNRANPDPVVKLPLSRTAFTLDSSGVAGFFGGESAVRAMSTVNLVPKRRWFGWYNSPGSYEVAKQYSKLANSHIFDALFPGDDSDPAKILMVDGRVGPEHTLLHFPSQRGPEPIGHLGSLIARKISKVPTRKDFPRRKKHTMDARVTLVKLNRELSREDDELDLSPSESNIFAIGTILISIGGCVACALVADWFCLSSIALGIIANGVACSVIGSGKLSLKHNPPAQTFAPGDVVLRTDTEIIVLIGNAGSVSPITRARFLLRFGETSKTAGLEDVQSSHGASITVECKTCGAGAIHVATCSDRNTQHTIHISTPAPNPPAITSLPFSIPQRHLIDISVILLLSQFLAQLLLIPQGTLFGQIMFIGTLIPSWVYHSYLSSLSLDLQTEALFHKLSIQEKDDIFRYQFNTWTEAVVFTCLAFREIHPDMSLPTTTREMSVAQGWKETKSGAGADMARTETALEVENVVTAAAQEAVADTKKDNVKNAVENEQKTDAAKKAQEAVADTKEDNVKNAVENEQKTDAAKKAQEAVPGAGGGGVKNALENEQKTDAAKKAKAAKQEKDAFRALLNAVLPGKTDVWQAFKESLARKLGATDDSSDQIDLDSDDSFNFEAKDRLFVVQDASGKPEYIRVIQGKDKEQLEGYWEDAKNAFQAWRSVRRIASVFPPSIYNLR